MAHRDNMANKSYYPYPYRLHISPVIKANMANVA